jgi:hypothetical protein
VARGAHVVTDDFVAALQDQSIGGVALDVTQPKPLPAGHPLWSLDNYLITPHTANTWEMTGPCSPIKSDATSKGSQPDSHSSAWSTPASGTELTRRTGVATIPQIDPHLVGCTPEDWVTGAR